MTFARCAAPPEAACGCGPQPGLWSKSRLSRHQAAAVRCRARGRALRSAGKAVGLPAAWPPRWVGRLTRGLWHERQTRRAAPTMGCRSRLGPAHFPPRERSALKRARPLAPATFSSGHPYGRCPLVRSVGISGGDVPLRERTSGGLSGKRLCCGATRPGDDGAGRCHERLSDGPFLSRQRRWSQPRSSARRG